MIDLLISLLLKRATVAAVNTSHSADEPWRPAERDSQLRHSEYHESNVTSHWYKLQKIIYTIRLIYRPVQVEPR
jgi:hypothetical protein